MFNDKWKYEDIDINTEWLRYEYTYHNGSICAITTGDNSLSVLGLLYQEPTLENLKKISERLNG